MFQEPKTHCFKLLWNVPQKVLVPGPLWAGYQLTLTDKTENVEPIKRAGALPCCDVTDASTALSFKLVGDFV